MPKPIVFLLLIVLCTKAKGQEKIYENNQWFAVKTRVATLTNPEKCAILTSYISRPFIKRVITSKNLSSLNYLHQFGKDDAEDDTYQRNSPLSEAILKLYWESSYIGGQFNTMGIVEVLRDKNNFDFAFTETDFQSGKTVVSDTVQSTFKEKIISCIARQDQLLLLTYLNETNTLHIYQKQLGRTLEKKVLTINNNGFGRLSNRFLSGDVNEFSGLFRKNSFAVYENNLRYHPLFTSVRTKAFVQKDKVVFTINSNDLSTYAISVDLNDFHYTLRRFELEPIAKNLSQAATTSVLIDSLLVTSHFYAGELRLRVFNLNSGNQLAAFNLQQNNIDSFSNEPLQKTGSFWSKTDVAPEEFKAFEAASYSNQLSLAGYIAGGKLHLMFATPYKQFLDATAISSLTMTAAGTYFINAAPNTYGFMLVSFPQVKTVTFIGFGASLSLPDFSPASAKGYFSIWEKVAAYLQTRKVDIRECQFFYMNGYYYIGHFADRQYGIFRFDERGFE